VGMQQPPALVRPRELPAPGPDACYAWVCESEADAEVLKSVMTKGRAGAPSLYTPLSNMTVTSEPRNPGRRAAAARRAGAAPHAGARAAGDAATPYSATGAAAPAPVRAKLPSPPWPRSLWPALQHRPLRPALPGPAQRPLSWLAYPHLTMYPLLYSPPLKRVRHLSPRPVPRWPGATPGLALRAPRHCCETHSPHRGPRYGHRHSKSWQGPAL
jgi:hypothetical protein